MSAGMKRILCPVCRKKVSYHIVRRPARELIKDLEIDYVEYYGVCDECNEEIFVPGLDDENEKRIEQLYRKIKHLISVEEINFILKKYDIEKRPLSKLLGFGELTITRYLDGQMPSKKYSDILYLILNDEKSMKKIVDENKELVSTVTVRKVRQAIDKIEKEKKADTAAEKFALYITYYGKEITNLALQKILYYVKGISCLYGEKSMIPDACEAWKLGPVFPAVYQKYKNWGSQIIASNVSKEYIDSLLTEEEKQVADLILKTFGIYNAWFLKNITHLEEPWLSAHAGVDNDAICRNEIDNSLICDYFIKMNKLFDLKTTKGIDRYIDNMKEQL